MTNTIALAAAPRDRAGKGAARATRREGRVPAVIYGEGKPPVTISLEERVLARKLESPAFFTQICEIEVDGDTYQTLARDVQLHPVTDRPLHADFLRVGKNTEIAVAVPVHFTNESVCPGLKRGGVLNVVRHEVEVYCKATEIPDFLEVDLAGFNINDTVHWSDAKPVEGVRPVIDDRDFTIATVTAPSALKSGDDEAADAGGEDAGQAA